MALVTHQSRRRQHRYGSRRAADRPEGFHRRLSALRAHRAARRDRVSAHALRHAGDLFREPAEAAAGYSQSAPHHPAGSAAHVGAHLFHHLHRTAQDARRPSARPSTARSAWGWPPPATGAKASPCRRAFASRWRWPTAFSSARCAAASAAGCMSLPAARRRSARTWREFYEAIGMPLIEGYGLTEGGVVSLNPLDRPKPGSIGKPLAGVEVTLQRRWRNPGQEPLPLFRLPQRSRRPPRKCCATAGCTPANRPCRRGWLRLHHRAQEGTDRLFHRQEDLSLARGEPVQDGAADQPGAADRRPPAVPDGALHHQRHRCRSAEGHGDSGRDTPPPRSRRRRRCWRRFKRRWRA